MFLTAAPRVRLRKMVVTGDITQVDLPAGAQWPAGGDEGSRRHRRHPLGAAHERRCRAPLPRRQDRGPPTRCTRHAAGAGSSATTTTSVNPTARTAPEAPSTHRTVPVRALAWKRPQAELQCPSRSATTVQRRGRTGPRCSASRPSPWTSCTCTPTPSSRSCPWTRRRWTQLHVQWMDEAGPPTCCGLSGRSSYGPVARPTIPAQATRRHRGVARRSPSCELKQWPSHSHARGDPAHWPRTACSTSSVRPCRAGRGARRCSAARQRHPRRVALDRAATVSRSDRRLHRGRGASCVAFRRPAGRGATPPSAVLEPHGPRSSSPAAAAARAVAAARSRGMLGAPVNALQLPAHDPVGDDGGGAGDAFALAWSFDHGG